MEKFEYWYKTDDGEFHELAKYNGWIRIDHKTIVDFKLPPFVCRLDCNVSPNLDEYFYKEDLTINILN